MTDLPTVHTASGVHLYDTDGNEYLDASSGVLNVNLGHGHPAVLRAITEQVARITFVHRSQFGSAPLDELTAELGRIAPDGAGHVEYANSGSEANETALRIALAHHCRRGEPDRVLVLSEQPSYHGMTAGALALTGQPAKRDAGVEPLLANATTTPRVLSEPGRLRAGIADWDCALDMAGPERVAAVVVEPVGGSSSGAATMDGATLRHLRARADRDGFLLIADEVMSGFGRTGRWWACDHAGVAPDLLTSGKGVSCGFTSLAVTFVADRVVRAFGDTPIGSIVFGHTMSGNPLAAATCLAVLRELRTLDAPSCAEVAGRHLRDELTRLAARHPVVTCVRGRGLMLGLGLAGLPDRPLALAGTLIRRARERGLVLCPGGIDADTESVMVAPPLVVTRPELDEMVSRLDAALGDLAPDLAPEPAAEPAPVDPARDEDVGISGARWVAAGVGASHSPS